MRRAAKMRQWWHVFASAIALLGCVAAARGADEGSVKERLERLERTLSSSGLIELVQQVEALQQEVRQLRGEIENQNFTLEQVRNSQRDAYLDTDRRLSAIEQGRGPAGLPTEPPVATLDSQSTLNVAGTPSDQTMSLQPSTQPAGPIGPNLAPTGAAPSAAAGPNVTAPLAASPGAMVMAPATSDPSGGILPPPGQASQGVNPPAAAAIAANVVPQAPAALAPAPGAGVAALAQADNPQSEAAYRDAFALLKAGQYEQSIAAFSQYLQLYPHSQYADNAQYWLGEAYYVMRQYEPAIAQYQALVQTYPDSQKQSHAMLKIAYSYDELGLAEQAAAVLAELKQKFPDSAAARLADERLARMRARGAQ